MNTALARPRTWRSIPALLIAIALAFAGLVVGASPARAAEGDVVGATLQWGVKESFRNYLAMPFAHGSVTVSGGVTDAMPYTWSSGAGSSQAGSAAYPGAVHFTAHDGALDIHISNVTVQRTATGGAVVADVVSKDRDSGDPLSFPHVQLATFPVANWEPVDGTVTVANAPATLTDAGSAVFGGMYAAGEAVDPVSFSWPVEQAPAPQPAPTPTITVSKTNGLVSGDLVTVRGAGFGDPSVLGARPPLWGKFAGTYVVFGSFADEWKPSEGVGSSARKVGDQRWVVSPEDVETIGGAAAGGVAINPDGSFEVQLEVEEGFEGVLEDGNYGIYTYAGSGASHAPFETYTPITFADDAAEPTVTVTKAPATGGEVTVTGSGFATDEEDSPGVYVGIGAKGAPGFYQAGIAEGATKFVPTAVIARGGGSFTVKVTAPASAPGGFSVYVSKAHGQGIRDTSQDAIVPVEYEAATTPTTPTNPTTPTTPPTPAPTPPAAAVAAGSLTWGVKSAFRNYVTGPIANGSISVSGAKSAGGAFVFTQAGGTFTAATGAGTADYSGSVRFTGHGGSLSLTFANPTIEVISAQRGNLHVSVNGARVLMGTLNLAAATRTEVGGAVTYTGAPVTLTAAGANAFNGFYGAGEALDQISFTVGAPAAAASGGTVVVASAPARPATRTPAPTPPATTGVEVVEGEAVPGGEVTITASGFQPNETGILVVIYSDPIVLDRNATADANGVVTWTGVLPASLTGEHTLTLQGSVNRGVPITIAESMMRTTSLDTCAVTNATVTWGFKEAFRSYVSGTIAKGEWTVADGATYETPNFGFTSDGGTYDTATGSGEISLPGAITFTGHGGVLNTTVSSPRIEFDGDTGRLFLDVSGETRDGESVDQVGVHFADLDLSGAVDETDSGVAITDAAAVLTPEGSAAFGTYETGTELDPITLELAVEEGCDAVATPRAEEPAAEESIETDETTADWLPWIISGVLLLVVIALLVALLARRRSKE